VIGAAMEQWGLHRRVALRIMLALGTRPRRLLLGVLVATASVSLWISNTATAVMMMPIARALLVQIGARPRFGCAVMLAVAYGANIGGIGTKIGTATNSIFAGFLSEKLGYEVGFLRYLAVGLPFVMLMVPLSWAVLWRVGRADAPAEETARAVLDEELRALGPPSRGERIVAAVFVAAAALWIGGDAVRAALPWRVPSKQVEAAVAMAAATVLIVLRAVSASSLRRVPWGTLVLLGGSFALAAGIEGSGLAAWLAARMAALGTLPLLGQVAVASFATVALTAMASNTATVNVMLNLLGRSPVVLSASAIAASCDFALPAGTPPNAIVFGSGLVRLPTMMRTGALLDVAAAALVTLYAWLWLPLVLR
jgi:sodium-dependent dicarboxylate transporter 2/3/5